MAAQDDIVDLTDLTSPEEQLHGMHVGGKRRRSEAIDLAADDSDEEARRRIMRFARRVNAERGLADAAPASVQQQQQGQQPQQPQQQQLAAAATAVSSHHQPQPNQQRAVAESAEEAGAVLPANKLLAALHAERMARHAQRQQQQQQQQQQQRQQEGGAAGAGQPQPHGNQQGAQPARQQLQWQGKGAAPRQPPPQAQARLLLLTYNVWFREDIHVQARMAAIGAIIEARQPDFVCLQEVTPLIFHLLSSGAWWGTYHATPCPPGTPYFTLLLWHRTRVQGAPLQAAQLPFENSIMGRDLKSISGTVHGLPVRVATSHLESPTGGNALYSEQRVAQCKQSVLLLNQAREEDVLFAGDMNWNPSDGQPPLPGGWCDAWQELFPGDAGLTYDPKSNPMLKPGNRIRRRLDRVFCRLRSWQLQGAELVGREPLPGLTFEGRPVLPSDHFGLLLQLRPA